MDKIAIIYAIGWGLFILLCLIFVIIAIAKRLKEYRTDDFEERDN